MTDFTAASTALRNMILQDALQAATDLERLASRMSEPVARFHVTA